MSISAPDEKEAYRRLGRALADYNGKDDDRHPGSIAMEYKAELIP